MRLSKSEMAMYAAAAGFPNPGQMAEVGYAESGGDTNIVNSIGAVGVLQVLQPVHVKDHPTWTVAWLKNPYNNFRAGKVLYDADKRAGGNGLRPWEDSRLKGNGGGWGKTSGAVQADIDWEDPLGIIPDDDSGSVLGGGIPEINTGLSGLTDIAKLGVRIGQWSSNPRNWLSAGYVLIGGVVIVVALSATVRGQVIGQVASIGNKVMKK
jgi:hypothetical protein